MVSLAQNTLRTLLLAALVLFFLPNASLAQGAKPQLESSNRPRTLSPARPLRPGLDYVPETLLVMLNPSADKQEVADAIKDMHGTVVGTIGEGALTTLVLQTEPGTLDETEKKLRQDSEHFGQFQRNSISKPCAAYDRIPWYPNDPFFSLQWHLGVMDIPQAWEDSTAYKVMIAICDTGVTNCRDLFNKLYSGLDAHSLSSLWSSPPGNRDLQGHGTLVATTAAAYSNNRISGAAPAANAYIYPIRVTGPSGGATDDALIRALKECITKKIRVCNMSFAMDDTRYSLANPKAHPVLHEWMKAYDSANGLLFMSAGNNKKYDPSPRCHYLFMVSAMTPDYKLASFSNWGDPIWFSAPGVNIYCTDKDGQAACVNGTSFASPLVAAVAAMILEKAPGLTNRQVAAILLKGCLPPIGGWNTEFGYGVPSASKCLSYVSSFSRGIGDDDAPPETVAQPVREGPGFELDQTPPAEPQPDDRNKRFVPPPIPDPDTPSFPSSEESEQDRVQTATPSPRRDDKENEETSIVK